MSKKNKELIASVWNKAESYEVAPKLAADELAITMRALNDARKHNKRVAVVLDCDEYRNLRAVVMAFINEAKDKDLDAYLKVDFQQHAHDLTESSVIIKMLFDRSIELGLLKRMPADVYLALKMNLYVANDLQELHEELQGIDKEEVSEVSRKH